MADLLNYRLYQGRCLRSGASRLNCPELVMLYQRREETGWLPRALFVSESQLCGRRSFSVLSFSWRSFSARLAGPGYPKCFCIRAQIFWSRSGANIPDICLLLNLRSGGPISFNGMQSSISSSIERATILVYYLSSSQYRNV